MKYSTTYPIGRHGKETLRTTALVSAAILIFVVGAVIAGSLRPVAGGVTLIATLAMCACPLAALALGDRRRSGWPKRLSGMFRNISDHNLRKVGFLFGFVGLASTALFFYNEDRGAAATALPWVATLGIAGTLFVAGFLFWRHLEHR